jgi:chromosome transmission fidelity protein 18
MLMSSQEWEIAPYQSSPVLAFHHLFAQSSASRAFSALNDTKILDTETELDSTLFSGPSAPYMASESLKANSASIQTFHSTLSHSLSRTYCSRTTLATELLPYVLCFLAPDVKPVVIHSSSNNSNGSGPVATVRRAEEKERVARAVECMAATGVRFERSRVEGPDGSSGGYVYRMEPSLDALGTFEGFKATGRSVEGVRFAVRQVLEGEWRRRATANNRTPSYINNIKQKNGSEKPGEAAAKAKDVKRDFFGRIIQVVPKSTDDVTEDSLKIAEKNASLGRVWVSYHEGFSNAVRRPVTLDELMRGL